MESEWGANVSRQGMGQIGATLAARILGTLFVWITNSEETGIPDTVWGFEMPGNPDFPILIGVYPKLDPTANFPYGYHVTPP